VWDKISEEVYLTAFDHGFIEKGTFTDKDSCQALAMMHSEISECIEALRSGNKINVNQSFIGYFDEELELADLLIRVMVYAKRKGYDLPGAILAKNEYNKTRPHKHGKKF